MCTQLGLLLLCCFQILQSAPVEKTVKRSPSPMTASWANLLYKPSQLKEVQKADTPKRSALPGANSYGSQWEHFMRTPQGFRLNDADRHYLSNAVLYKRAMNHIQELNSVPMLGKRNALTVEDLDNSGSINDEDDTTSENIFVFDPEFWKYIDSGLLERGDTSVNTNDDRVEDSDTDGDNIDWNIDDEFPNQLTDTSLMGDDAAYTPPAVGPHYRTILTRIQRSFPQEVKEHFKSYFTSNS